MFLCIISVYKNSAIVSLSGTMDSQIPSTAISNTAYPRDHTLKPGVGGAIGARAQGDNGKPRSQKRSQQFGTFH